MSKKNILVFPCGSEVALEIYRSMEHSIHFNLIGASSVDDHGMYVYNDYIGGVPYATDPRCIDALSAIVRERNVDAIFPAMDSVITLLKKNEQILGCKVISSDLNTTEICLSKAATYRLLSGVIRTPRIFESLPEIDSFPVFMKPDVGYGSRGTKKIHTKEEAEFYWKKNPEALFQEYLPGKEYTVDCFTNFEGKLLFAGARIRSRISNGISVNTKTIADDKPFLDLAQRINANIKFNGAWFFQVKESADGELVLMEIASRLGGSSGIFRAKGVNFANLAAFNIFEIPVSIVPNTFAVEMDRSLNNQYKLDIAFEHVYVDLDDTLILNDIVNDKLVGMLYKCINANKKIHLITKHKFDLPQTLKKYRLDGLFDTIIHLKPEDEKWRHMSHSDAIFIDDSYAERSQVKLHTDISTFDVNIYF